MRRWRVSIATGSRVDKVGFAKHGEMQDVGISVDGLVGKEGSIEIKCPYNSQYHLINLNSGMVPSDYKYQVQGAPWILKTGRSSGSIRSWVRIPGSWVVVAMRPVDSVRQAGAGERLIVTVDGRPVAQLGPIQPDTNGVTLWDLAAAGLISPPRRPDRPPDPDPLPVPADLSADRLLEASRGR